MKSFRLLLLACSFLVPGLLSSAGDLEFQLLGPKVTKIGWKARSLVATDVDGDGRTDLAVINNDRARIELLYQRAPGEEIHKKGRASIDRWEPVLEDAPFDKRNVSTGIQMYALSAGDLDRDGRIDLVYTGTPDELTIRFQDDEGRFPSKRVIEVGAPVTYIASLTIDDIDSDGANELALLTTEKLIVFEYEEGNLRPRLSYALSSDSCDALMALDANRDGRIDLCYQVPQDQDRFRVRFGTPDNAFGPEHTFRLDEIGGVLKPIDLPDDDAPAFVRVQWHAGLVEVLSMRERSERDTLLKDIRPRTFSAETHGKAQAVYAVTDLDGDGLPDFVFADSKSARIRVVLQESPGEFGETDEFPALTDVRSLAAADLDGDGRTEILMASPRERTVSVTGLTEGGRLSYPTPLPTIGKPWAVVAADFDDDGEIEVAYAFEDKRERGVAILDRPDGNGEFQASVVPMTELKADPRGLEVFDANRDGLPDLAVLTPHEPIHLLLQDADGGFSESSIDSGFRKGLVHDVEASELTTGDVDGDGKDELIVGSKGFARALRVSADGSLEVVDQFNARSGDATVAAAMVADLDADDVPEVILVIEGSTDLEVLKRRADGVYTFAESAPVGSLALVEARVTDLDGNDRPDLLLFGEKKFYWLPVSAGDLALVSVATYETDLKNVTPRLLGVGDLNDDGRHDIIAIDSRDSRILEVINRDEHGEWTGAMHFTIFDVDPHYEGQRGSSSEPSEIVTADLNNDGKDDLALLTHDRVLVYTSK